MVIDINMKIYWLPLKVFISNIIGQKYDILYDLIENHTKYSTF